MFSAPASSDGGDGSGDVRGGVIGEEGESEEGRRAKRLETEAMIDWCVKKILKVAKDLKNEVHVCAYTLFSVHAVFITFPPPLSLSLSLSLSLPALPHSDGPVVGSVSSSDRQNGAIGGCSKVRERDGSS